ncbi:hypothetical protein ACLB2K_015683 [Fragaria x ananassa]
MGYAEANGGPDRLNGLPSWYPANERTAGSLWSFLFRWLSQYLLGLNVINEVNANATFVVEPVRILDRSTKRLQRKEVDLVRVCWSHHDEGDASWELESDMRAKLDCLLIKKKYLGRHSTDREVALMILMAYLSYMVAELFDLSSILTVFFCGIVMSHYTWHNVTEKSRVTTNHGFATLSFISEIIIFLYVGMDALNIEKWKLVSESPGKSIGVSSILLVLVLVGRAASVFPLCFLSNLFRKSQSDKIGFKQQVTVWWAGLMRGAVSVALAFNWFTISGRTQQPGNAIMITSTITVVLFTNVVCGLLTKPLVRFLSPQQHKQSTNNMSSELSFEMSLVLPVLTNREDPKQDSMLTGRVTRRESDQDLPAYSFSAIKTATDDFADSNKPGEGGYGPVYKGKLLQEGQEIAVKRLSKISRQGLEEFKNEVSLIRKLQHRNLVRLLGCCTEEEESILIYEFMPNNSLDSFIFDSSKRVLLDWARRMNIIEGIAQALLYLHKYSRLRIIHRDLKTSNILLDCDMNPKISDFGMARIVGDCDKRGQTNRVVGADPAQGLFELKPSRLLAVCCTASPARLLLLLGCSSSHHARALGCSSSPPAWLLRLLLVVCSTGSACCSAPGLLPPGLLLCSSCSVSRFATAWMDSSLKNQTLNTCLAGRQRTEVDGFSTETHSDTLKQ